MKYRHFPMDVLVKNDFYGNPRKNYRCALQAKSWQINGIQVHSWYSSWLYAYRWDADWYMVHVYRSSGSIGAYHCIGMVRKIEFLICGPRFATGILLYIEVRLLGNSLFYLVSAKYGPDRYIMYREGTSTNLDRGSGLDNSYCNYLAIICVTFPIKILFSRG